MKGSCLCGEISYGVTKPFEEMHHCHCSMCRKAHGAAFSTFAQTGKSDLRVLTGEDKLRNFQSSSFVERAFCSECGSSLFFRHAARPDAVWVAVGSLDGDPGLRPQAHIFTSSKACWHEIEDRLPKFPEYPTEG